MGILDFIKGELLEIIEWTDDSRDTLSWRFPDDDKAIKRGAQLIVRESQVAQFVYLGEFGDTFGPGKHTPDHRQHPDPHPAQVLAVRLRIAVQGRRLLRHHPPVHRQQVGHVEPGDAPRRRLRRSSALRAFGTYDFKMVEPKTFLREVAGSDHNFRLDEFSDTMRSRIVSIFTDAIASAKSPGARRGLALHRAGRRAAAADQSGRHRQVRPRDHELHRRERVGAAGGRAGDGQALAAWPRSAT